jgi:hypothetical protein
MFKCDVCTFCGLWCVCDSVFFRVVCQGLWTVMKLSHCVWSAGQCGRHSIVLGVGSVCRASKLLCWYWVWCLGSGVLIQCASVCTWSCVQLLGHMVNSILCLDCVFIYCVQVCVSGLVKKLRVWCVDMYSVLCLDCVFTQRASVWVGLCACPHLCVSYLLLWSKWLVRAKIWQS